MRQDAASNIRSSTGGLSPLETILLQVCSEKYSKASGTLLRRERKSQKVEERFTSQGKGVFSYENERVSKKVKYEDSRAKCFGWSFFR